VASCTYDERTLARYTSKREEGDTMSEERPQHPQEPAEGAEDAVETPGFDRAGDDDGGMREDNEERSVEHPQEPAERAEGER
jgi:hypothetical protein